MSSPFPGMDPYLEAPHVWPGFHHKFASELSTELNGVLPVPYYAELEMRPELGIVEQEGERQRIVPDVTVVRYPDVSEGAGGRGGGRGGASSAGYLAFPRFGNEPRQDPASFCGNPRPVPGP